MSMYCGKLDKRLNLIFAIESNRAMRFKLIGHGNTCVGRPCVGVKVTACSG